MSRRFTLALTLLLCAASPAAIAQVSETITVSVTNVDVVVRDDRGNPVRGLKQEDFEILEGGKLREITNFSEVTTAEATPRRILIVIDGSTLTGGPRREMVDSMKTWLPQVLRENDRVAIASLNPTPSIKLKWSNDPAAIAEALDAVRKEPNGRLEVERRRTDMVIKDVIDRGNDTSQNAGQVSFEELIQVGRNFSASSQRHTNGVISAISLLFNEFSRGPEKKIAILAGEGLPSRPGSDVWTELNLLKGDIEAGRTAPRLRATARTANPMAESMQFDSSTGLNSLTEMARRRAITIYGLNPARTRSVTRIEGGGMNTSMASDFAAQANSFNGYNQLVRETGGLSFPGSQAQAALTDLSKDFDSLYTIGFRGEPGSGNVVVKTKVGHKARSIVVSGGVSRDQLVQESVVAHLITPPATNDLGIELVSDPPVAAEGKRRVKLKVLIPVEKLKLVKEGSEVTGGINVYVSSGNASGLSTPVNKQTHMIRWPAGVMAQAAGKKLTYALNVMIDEAVEEISVGVLDQRSETTGFERVKVGG